MRKLIVTGALAAIAVATPAVAQQRGGILIVDSDRVLSDCTACKAANAQLQQRQTTLRSRAGTLQQQIQAEGKTLQAAVDALKGKDPDAALQARITAFENKQRSAQQELATSQQTFQSTASNVQQQIGAKVVVLVEQVRARRGAAIVLAKNSTIANDSAIDITGEVLTALNAQLPSVSVTPQPQAQQQQQQPAQPQGR